jgi:hypothetical protein
MIMDTLALVSSPAPLGINRLGASGEPARSATSILLKLLPVGGCDPVPFGENNHAQPGDLVKAGPR